MEELADITFGWMVDLCQPLLSFSHEYLVQIASQHESYLRARRLHNPETASGYAVGPIKDTYVPYIGYLLGGSTPRTPGQYDSRNRNRDPNYVADDTNECFHPSVRARWRTLGEKWMPSPIHGWSAQWVPEARKRNRAGGSGSRSSRTGRVSRCPSVGSAVIRRSR